jgi:hypothetical protein
MSRHVATCLLYVLQIKNAYLMCFRSILSLKKLPDNAEVIIYHLLREIKRDVTVILINLAIVNKDSKQVNPFWTWQTLRSLVSDGYSLRAASQARKYHVNGSGAKSMLKYRVFRARTIRERLSTNEDTLYKKLYASEHSGYQQSIILREEEFLTTHTRPLSPTHTKSGPSAADVHALRTRRTSRVHWKGQGHIVTFGRSIGGLEY